MPMRPGRTTGSGAGKTKKAYLWAYRSNDLQPGPRIIVFDYRNGLGGAHAASFLARGKAI